MPMRMLHVSLIFHCCATLSLLAGTQAFETDPQAVAQCLASLDTWIIAQPKTVLALPGASFPLNQCKGVVVEGTGDSGAELGSRHPRASLSPAAFKSRCSRALLPGR